MFVGGAVIYVGVLAAFAWAATRRGPERPGAVGAWLVGGGLVFPGVVLLALLVYAVAQGDALVPRPGAGAVRVEAHARRWAWEFVYPDAAGGPARSRGVLHVPAGRPFDVTVRSPDVIHSFWVPRLGGKIDAIPGHVNVVRLQADAPGAYGGLCAEYCGTGHAHMGFVVRAHAPEAYAEVIARLPRAVVTSAGAPAAVATQ